MKIHYLLLMVCTAARLPAAIVSVTLPEPVQIDYRGGSGNFQSFDLDQDGQDDVQFVSDPFLCGFVTFGNNRTPSILFDNFGGAVVPVYAGESIGLLGQYTNGGSLHNSRENLPETEFTGGYSINSFMISEDGYIGVEFQAATGTHYGWLRWKGGGGPWGRVYGWAWETEPGVPIIAGAVPEPAGATLLLAATSALLWRRRRGLRSIS